MSRFNVRATNTAPPPPPPEIRDKKPSAYAAMKHGTSAPDVITLVEEKPKKAGRPSKEELRRHKLALASGRVAVLIENKPTKAKIRDHMQSRIMELDAEMV